jgi:CyaY protein
MLSEAEYVALAQAELSTLVNALDEVKSDHLDCELENDILTLELGEDSTYVINSHRAARQIWMAAERTAWHFDWNPERSAWIAAKNGDELWATVRRVLTPFLPPSEVAKISPPA